MLLRLLVISGFAVSCMAQSVQGPTFADTLRQVRTPLVLRDTTLSGAGGNLLMQEIAASRFVLIGETHLTREIPQFTAAICAAMKPDAYAVEASPLAARFVAGQLHDSHRIANMRAMLQRSPSNMAFLDIREENDLAASCAALSQNPHFQLWGLDQEFLGAGGTLLDAMLDTKPGPRSTVAIHVAQENEQAAANAARSSGDLKQLYMLNIQDAELQQLSVAIRTDGTPETALLLSEFTESHHIYRLNLAGQPESNHLRAEMLKQHLVADYLPFHGTEPQGRVLFKFGAMHMGRGFDMLHQLNLGNTVAEIADVEGVRSLHIFVLGAAGISASQQGYGKPLHTEPFDLTTDQDIGWLAPALSNILPASDHLGGTTLTLLDLRKVRFRELSLAPEWEQLIYSYDLLILIPRVTPATSLE